MDHLFQALSSLFVHFDDPPELFRYFVSADAIF